MLYEWTHLHFLNRSDLHAVVLKRKLAPQLSKYLGYAAQEVDYGWKIDVPQSDGEWIGIYHYGIIQTDHTQTGWRLTSKRLYVC